ncbi:MAG TPA: hypothetical protein VIF64_04440 [Pyrinomonadaceae bacterium]
MRRKMLGSFLSIVVLTSCVSQKTQSTKTQEIRTKKPTESRSEQIQFRRYPKETLEGVAAEKDLLRIGFEILPIDKDTIFLYGDLRTAAASIGTFILRSDDAGRSWTESMNPVEGSTVDGIVFSGRESGWALVMWTIEGPGDVSLYRSRDSGKSWKKVSDIPKRHHWGWPNGFTFSDDSNGTVEMFYGDAAGPEIEGLWLLKTADGGRTWRGTRKLSGAEYEKQRLKSSEAKALSPDIFSAHDGSQWKVEEEGELIHILRRLPADQSWKVICTTPAYFEVSDGKLVGHYKKTKQ